MSASSRCSLITIPAGGRLVLNLMNCRSRRKYGKNDLSRAGGSTASANPSCTTSSSVAIAYPCERYGRITGTCFTCCYRCWLRFCRHVHPSLHSRLTRTSTKDTRYPWLECQVPQSKLMVAEAAFQYSNSAGSGYQNCIE